MCVADLIHGLRIFRRRRVAGVLPQIRGAGDAAHDSVVVRPGQVFDELHSDCAIKSGVVRQTISPPKSKVGSLIAST